MRQNPFNGILLFQTAAGFASTAWATTKRTALARPPFPPLHCRDFSTVLPPSPFADRFVLSLLRLPAADVPCSSVWLTSSPSLWHVNPTLSLAELVRVTLHPIYIQRSTHQGSVQGHRRWYVTSASIKKKPGDGAVGK